MASSRNYFRRGFALLELVIVTVIVAIIAAIAIPRVSRGAAGAAEAALQRDLQLLNNAIEHYWAEHMSVYPTATNIARQLTLYSDITGTRFAGQREPGQGIIYGPYLRCVPPVPTGVNKGSTKISATAGPGVGWFYNTAENRIVANLKDLVQIIGTPVQISPL